MEHNLCIFFVSSPVYCLNEEKNEAELVLKCLYQRGKSFDDDLELPKIYNLEDLLFLTEKSVKRFNKKQNPEAENNGQDLSYLQSSAAALYKLKICNFLQVPGCSFHEELCRSEFCSLAIVRNRAFAIMDRLCDVSSFEIRKAFKLNKFNAIKLFTSVNLLFTSVNKRFTCVIYLFTIVNFLFTSVNSLFTSLNSIFASFEV